MTRTYAIISYAIREADGINALVDFLASVDRYKISSQSKIVIALKESSESFFDEVANHVKKAQKKNLRIQLTVIPPGGFDIGTHYYVASHFKCEVIIFMTATSRANVKKWDSLLLKKFRELDVGVVGCMQSSESLKSSFMEMVTVMIKMKFHIALNKRDALILNIRDMTQKKWKTEFSNNRITKLLVDLSTFLILYFYKKEEPFRFLHLFPDFPNPHLRTTGFAIRRELFLSVFTENPKDKWDAFNYESGYGSLTRRCATLGWKLLVVNMRGRYYNFGDTDAKTTFRYTKADSIVTDKESRRFHQLSIVKQKKLNIITHLG
jgi:hypothetical protein